jgi:hypothetical protein
VEISKIEGELFICTGVVHWALILWTGTKLAKDVIIYSVKVKLSVFILLTGSALTVDSRRTHCQFSGRVYGDEKSCCHVRSSRYQCW